MRGLVSLAVQEAKLAGLAESQFRNLTQGIVRSAYSASRPQIGFIECNELDAATLSRDIQEALHHPVEPLLIDHVVANPLRFSMEYDILAVNLAHLAELEAALSKVGRGEGGAQVFGLHVPVDADSLTRVARLREGTALGIVCDMEQTMASLTGLVSGCNRAISTTTCLSHKRSDLKRLVRSSDVLLVTPSSMERVGEAEPRVPVIQVSFRPDTRSIAQLADILAERSKLLDAVSDAQESYAS